MTPKYLANLGRAYRAQAIANELERVIREERERCAKIAEEYLAENHSRPSIAAVAAAIRSTDTRG